MAISTRSCRRSSSESPPKEEPPLPELRAATARDVEGLLSVFFEAAEDLDRRRGRPVSPRNPAPLDQLLRHLIDTDPASAVVADVRERPVAFGVSHVRGSDGFLSFLFVRPEWQGQGLGRTVLGACLAGAGSITRMATCAEADQPVSTGLYGSLGWAPRLPIYLVRGALATSDLPQLADDVRVRPLQAAQLEALDTELLGYTRSQDHAFWLSTERQGWQFEGPDGGVFGYGYAHRSGRIGPVAANDSELLPPIIGYIIEATSVLEGWQVVVPGTAISALAALLRAGLRIDGSPAVYCADRPGPAFERYLPASYALL